MSVLITREKEEKITFSFGENKMGLTNELHQIGKEIEKLSENYSVYLHNLFINKPNNSFDFVFYLIPLKKEIPLELEIEANNSSVKLEDIIDSSIAFFLQNEKEREEILDLLFKRYKNE